MSKQQINKCVIPGPTSVLENDGHSIHMGSKQNSMSATFNASNPTGNGKLKIDLDKAQTPIDETKGMATDHHFQEESNSPSNQI